MAELHYQELAFKYRQQRFELAQLDSQIAVLGEAIARIPDEDEKGNLKAHEKLLQIERLLTQAHQHFNRRRYEKALNIYERTLALLLEYLRPSTTVSAWGDLISKGVLVDADLTKQLSTVSYSLIKNFIPNRLNTELATFEPLPGEVEEAIHKYDGYGVKGVDQLTVEARTASDLGFSYAQNGQYLNAAAFFEQALRLSPNDQDTTAALFLNTGAALLQTKRFQEASQYLEQAREYYTSQEDRLGLAQVHQNLGIFFKAIGDEGNSRENLQVARELIEEVGGTIGDLNQPSRTDSHFSTVTNLPLSVQLRSTNLDTLNVLGTPDYIAFRQPGAGGGWAVTNALASKEREAKYFDKTVGFIQGDRIATLKLEADQVDGSQALLQQLYEPRVSATRFDQLEWKGLEVSDFAAQLPHLAHFVIPLAIGDCFHHLGRFEDAQTRYLQVARYRFLNRNIEAATVWLRLVENYLAWGDQHYKQEEIPEALDRYTQVITVEDTTPPGSPLFTIANLAVIADRARTFYANFEDTTLNPAIRSATLEIRARLTQIAAGLDFFGAKLNLIPIFTFRYLQDVARLFAQRAIQAEREYIRFTVSAENDEATRRQLQQAVERASEEVELQQEREELARRQEEAAGAAEAVAQQRRENAQRARDEYNRTAEEEVRLQQEMTWYSSQNPWELKNPIPGTGGMKIHQVLARDAERRARIIKAREQINLNNTVAEMQDAEVAAREQREAAEAQVDVARQMRRVAEVTLDHAQENLAAFQARTFTPELWHRMAIVMRSIAERYLNSAVEIAKRMEQAYNFENDTNLKIIKNQYAVERAFLNILTDGMLAGDVLLADIESFTYKHIITARSKPIRLKQTISLAENYPFLFYRFNFGSDEPDSPLRKGLMRFQTTLDEFDRQYPGTYRRRLEAVEVSVDGILPPGGIHGILSIGGASRFWTLERDGAGNFIQKTRLQPVETLLLSDYRIINDSLVFRNDGTLRGIFEGAGAASTWELELPIRSNDLDYALISDVRMTLYYTAFYDPQLDRWIRSLPVPTEDLRRNISFPLRRRFPDQYFAFQNEGLLEWNLLDIDFPLNQLNPQIQEIALQLIWEEGERRAVEINFATPSHTGGVNATTNATGRALSRDSGPLAPVASGSAVGQYALRINLPEGSQQDLLKIQDVILFLSYEYTLP